MTFKTNTYPSLGQEKTIYRDLKPTLWRNIFLDTGNKGSLSSTSSYRILLQTSFNTYKQIHSGLGLLT